MITQNIGGNDHFVTVFLPPKKRGQSRGNDMTWSMSSWHHFPNHSSGKNPRFRHDSKAELPSGEIQLLLSRCNGQVLATACYCRCLGLEKIQEINSTGETSRFKTHTQNLMLLVLLLGEAAWNVLYKFKAWWIDWKILNENTDGWVSTKLRKKLQIVASLSR